MDIPNDSWQHIFSFIPTKDVCRYLQLSKQFEWVRSYLYYRCLSDQYSVPFTDYLIPAGSLESYLPETIPEKVQDLMKHVMNIPYMSISGGFVSQLYRRQVPKESSDIDIFFLGGLDPSKEKEDVTHVFRSFIRYFVALYPDTLVETFTHSNSVFTLRSTAFPYAVQLICTNYRTVTEHLMNFDCSHVRCSFYKGTLYVTDDMEEAVQSGITYFTTLSSMKRYCKAIENGFTIGQFTKEQLDTLNEHVEYDGPDPRIRAIPVETCLETQLDFHREWKNRYERGSVTNPCNTSILYPIDMYSHTQVKAEWITIDDVKERLIWKQKMSTHIPHLTVYSTCIQWYLPLKNVGATTTNIYMKKNVGVQLRATLLDMMKQACGLTTIPEYIMKQSRDLIGSHAFNELCQTDSIKMKIHAMIQANGGLDARTQRILQYGNLYQSYPHLYKYFGYMYRDHIYVSDIPNEDESVIGGIHWAKPVPPRHMQTMDLNVQLNCVRWKSPEPTTYAAFGKWLFNVSPIPQ